MGQSIPRTKARIASIRFLVSCVPSRCAALSFSGSRLVRETAGSLRNRIFSSGAKALLLLRNRAGLREDHDVSSVSSVVGPRDRDGVGQAAIQELHAAHFDDPRDQGHGGRRAHPLDVLGVPVGAAVVDGRPVRTSVHTTWNSRGLAAKAAASSLSRTSGSSR